MSTTGILDLSHASYFHTFQRFFVFLSVLFIFIFIFPVSFHFYSFNCWSFLHMSFHAFSKKQCPCLLVFVQLFFSSVFRLPPPLLSPRPTFPPSTNTKKTHPLKGRGGECPGELRGWIEPMSSSWGSKICKWCAKEEETRGSEGVLGHAGVQTGADGRVCGSSCGRLELCASAASSSAGWREPKFNLVSDVGTKGSIIGASQR